MEASPYGLLLARRLKNLVKSEGKVFDMKKSSRKSKKPNFIEQNERPMHRKSLIS